MPLPASISAWSTVPTVAEELNVAVTAVRRMLDEGKLIALRAEPTEPLMIPSDFIQDRYIVKHLSGVLTLLADIGMDEDQIIEWLTTEDPTLPGSPLTALRENRGTEIKRRAQAEF